MGAWGPAIFSDDTAADVREEYLTLIGDGLSGPDATARLIEEWSSTVADAEEGPVFWLALAATQTNVGRLEDSVKARALEVIDGESHLARWHDDPKAQQKRRRHLEDLKRQLESPQPGPKRIRKRFREQCEWAIGEILRYRLQSGRSILFRVVGHHDDKGGRAPVCELLDWIGDDVPRKLRLRFFGIRRGGGGAHKVKQFMLARRHEKELPKDRLERLGMTLKPSQVAGDFTVFMWKSLDESLREYFGLE